MFEIEYFFLTENERLLFDENGTIFVIVLVWIVINKYFFSKLTGWRMDNYENNNEEGSENYRFSQSYSNLRFDNYNNPVQTINNYQII